MNSQLPIIDLNVLESSEEIIKLEKETINTCSVDIADKIIDTLLAGSVNPLEFAVKRRLVVDALELVMKHPKVKSLMIDEVEKFGKQGASAFGAKIGITSRAQYQYDKDPTWLAIKTNMKPFEEALKSQEEKIKMCCKTGNSLMDDDGIVVAHVVPSPSTTSITVSFSK